MAGLEVITGERDSVTDADGEREWVGLGEMVSEVEGDRVIEEDGVGDRLIYAVGDEQGDEDGVKGWDVATGEIVAVIEIEGEWLSDSVTEAHRVEEELGFELGLGQADGSTDIPVAPQAAGHVQGIGVSVLNGQ